MHIQRHGVAHFYLSWNKCEAHIGGQGQGFTLISVNGSSNHKWIPILDNASVKKLYSKSWNGKVFLCFKAYPALNVYKAFCGVIK